MTQPRRWPPDDQSVISCTCRHSFATDALVNGVGVAEVAELLSHTGTDRVMKHNQRLRQRREHFRNAVVKATRPTES